MADRALHCRMSRADDDVHYYVEGRALRARLNLEPDSRRTRWSILDPIWRHPTGGGVVYVGSDEAAESLPVLQRRGIGHVVNCTSGLMALPNYHEGALRYLHFPISVWHLSVDDTDASVLAFVKPLFEFVEAAVAGGGSVLVPCLMGAHRAGTAGVACLMHLAGMDVAAAVGAARACRPVIEPIGTFPLFLGRLQRALRSQAAAAGLQRER